MVDKKEGLLFVVSAPSGTGKTTLCREMLQVFPDLHYSISYTTRPLRPGDQKDRDYHFVSPAEFQKMIEHGDFAEWAEIYGHRYGTSRIFLNQAREEGLDVILDIDGQGARQLREKSVAGVFIFLLPPSIGELKRRLANRKTEGKEALAERLRKARREMAEAEWYDYWILNDDLEEAKERLKGVIQAERCRRERMAPMLEKILAGP
jgi:guanylate kinase